MDLGKRERTEHRYAEERLSAYLDGELTPQERLAVEQHLGRCQACRWNLHTLQQTVRLVAGLPTVPIPRAFTIPVATRPARAPQPRWSLPLLQGATALVALLLVVVVAGDLILTGLLPTAVPRTAVSYEQALPTTPAPSTVAQVPEGIGGEGTIPRETVAVEKRMVASPSPPPGEGAQAALPTEGPQTALPTEALPDTSTTGTPPPLPLPADAQAEAAIPPTATESVLQGESPPAGARIAITETETVAGRLPAPEPTITEAPAGEQEAKVAVSEIEATEMAAGEQAVTETEEMLAAAPLPTETGITVEAYGYEAPPQAQPPEPPALAGPTPLALVQEQVPAAKTGYEERGRAPLSDSAVVWLGVAEIALLVAFILLASATLLAMIRQHRTR